MGKERSSLSPLQDKIFKSQGELIVAYINYYNNMKKTAHTSYEEFYSLERCLQTGIITPKTRVSDREFITGVKKAYYKEICPAYDRDFEPLRGSFTPFFIKNPLSHLKEKQPDEEFFLCHFLSHVFIDPSLYLKIGNKDSIPLLQETLESWRYMELSGLLGMELPVNDKILNDLTEDKLKIFSEMRRLEKRIPVLKKAGKEFLELASDSESLLSVPAIAVNYGRAIDDSEKRYEVLLETAIKRQYHKSDICGKVEIGDDIITTTINFREFFSQRAKCVSQQKIKTS